ncbi:MAG: MFS transporter [Actinomycetia bacterium]|nr:MFS transporter [Actinomycetes bacterium]
MTETTGYRVYRYRWVVLGVFAVLNALVQMNWIVFASVTGDAAEFYGVSVLSIGFLSMIYMIVYIVVSIPASYVIDAYGIRIGVGVGATLTGIFALMRGVFATSYPLVLVATIGLAIGQPFVLNAITKIGANWFAVTERATAASIPALAQFIGIIIALAVAPLLVSSLGIAGMLWIYGALTVAGWLATVAFVRDRPPTPPDASDLEERITVFAGLRYIFAQRDMLILIALFFVGLGMFNAISTWIEQLVAPRGFDSEAAGIVGAVMLVGGIAGAGIISVLSDRTRRRKPFLVLALVGVVPGLVGLAFATTLLLLAVSSFTFGFFLMSAYPVGIQYGAEVSYPAPESTSQGVIVLAGQVAGIIFIFAMDGLRDGSGGSMSASMLVFIVMTIAMIILTSLLHESPMILAERDEPATGT